MYEWARVLGKFPTARLDEFGCRLLTKRVVVFISEEVYDEFSAYCIREGYVRPKLVELILEEFLDRFGSSDTPSE